MPDNQQPIAAYGASRLPSVEVDARDAEIKDDHGSVGERASQG